MARRKKTQQGAIPAKPAGSRTRSSKKLADALKPVLPVVHLHDAVLPVFIRAEHTFQTSRPEQSLIRALTEGLLHCEDGPALMAVCSDPSWPAGSYHLELFFRDGKPHFEPGIGTGRLVAEDGRLIQRWTMIDGRLNDVDGEPSLVWGDVHWFPRSEPLTSGSDADLRGISMEVWHQSGIRHRLDGPAVVCQTPPGSDPGAVDYWLDGERINEAKFLWEVRQRTEADGGGEGRLVAQGSQHQSDGKAGDTPDDILYGDSSHSVSVHSVSGELGKRALAKLDSMVPIDLSQPEYETDSGECLCYTSRPVTTVYKALTKGLLHREDGPALIADLSNGWHLEMWFIHGKPFPYEPDIGTGQIVDLDDKPYFRWTQNEAGQLDSLDDRPSLTSYHRDVMEYFWRRPGVVEEEWHRQDTLHRADGPAYQDSTGVKQYFYDGLLHRENGPAWENPGTGATLEIAGMGEHNPICSPLTAWAWHGHPHREDGEAVIGYVNERPVAIWVRHGFPHREDGPAVIFFDRASFATKGVLNSVSESEYWLDGEKLTEDGWRHRGGSEGS